MSTIKADAVTAVSTNADLSLDGLGTGGVSIASTLKMTKGGDIPSASPLVIDIDGNYFDVTGTTNFSAMTVEAGNYFMLQFDGALTITHGSGIELPGAANMTTATGDRLICYATAANTVVVMSMEKEAATAGGGWQFVQTVTPSGQNGIVIGEANIATGHDYMITMEDVKWDGDMGNGDPLLQFGTGGGPTYQTASYTTQGLFIFATSVVAQRDYVTDGIAGTNNVLNWGGAASGEVVHGIFEIFNPAANQLTRAKMHVWGDDNTSTVSQTICVGWRETADIVTGFRIMPSAAQEADSGTVKLYKRSRT